MSDQLLFLRHRNIVTVLTLLRAPLSILAPVLALCHAARPSRLLLVLVLLLMALSGVTDLLDGLLARRWKVVSRFGALADPLMDKVFFVATLPAAVFLALYAGDVRHALLLLALDVSSMLRDQWVSFLRSVASPYGVDVAAGWWGKLRTGLAFPVLMLVYLYLGLGSLGLEVSTSLRYGLFVLEAVLLAVTLASGVAYTRHYRDSLLRAMKE